VQDSANFRQEAVGHRAVLSCHASLKKKVGTGTYLSRFRRSMSACLRTPPDGRGRPIASPNKNCIPDKGCQERHLLSEAAETDSKVPAHRNSSSKQKQDTEQEKGTKRNANGESQSTARCQPRGGLLHLGLVAAQRVAHVPKFGMLLHTSDLYSV
jgi:hypothetical protein